jgi:hypothetical protein
MRCVSCPERATELSPGFQPWVSGFNKTCPERASESGMSGRKQRPRIGQLGFGQAACFGVEQRAINSDIARSYIDD